MKGRTMRELKFYGQNRTSRGTWDQVIAGLIEFNAGSMSGRQIHDRVRNTGDLPHEYAGELKSSIVDYIVYSYQTPIMWHDGVTGKWRFPRVSYSRTTHKHQQIAEYAIKVWDGDKWNTPDSFDDSGPRLTVDSHTDFLR